MDTKRAVVAGVIGTAVMTVLLLWAPYVGLPKLAIGELLSTFLAVSVAVFHVGPAGGWVIHGLVGIGLALLYAGLFAKLLPGGPVMRGLLYGLMVFCVAQLVFMPAVGAGVFSRGDVPMILGSLIGHLAYGGLVGAIYGERKSAGAVATSLIAILLGVGSAQAQGAAGAQPPQSPTDSPVLSDQAIEAGRATFHGSGTCHACHGDDLQGGAIAPSLRGPKWRHIDGTYGALLDRIRKGKDGTLMVAYPGGISDEEAVQVATYVWAVSQGKAKP